MVDGHVGGDGQAGLAGLAHQLHAGSRRQAAQVHGAAHRGHQFADGVQRHGLAGDGVAGQPQPRGKRPGVHHAAPRQEGVDGVQPHGVAEGMGVLHGAQQHLGVLNGLAGLGKAHAAGGGQLGHFGQRLALQAHGQGAQRVQVRQSQVVGAVLQHFHQARLIQRRVGVGRASQRRHASGHGGLHLGFQRGLVFEAWLAQAGGQVHQPRRHHQARAVDGPCRPETMGRRPHGNDAAIGHMQVGLHVQFHPGVHQARAGDGKRGFVPAAACLDHTFLHHVLLHPAASMLITAMRTAMPKVTCCRMTDCGPSATADSISTPRFIGPGCMTMASGLASASFSRVSP